MPYVSMEITVRHSFTCTGRLASPFTPRLMQRARSLSLVSWKGTLLIQWLGTSRKRLLSICQRNVIFEEDRRRQMTFIKCPGRLHIQFQRHGGDIRIMDRMTGWGFNGREISYAQDEHNLPSSLPPFMVAALVAAAIAIPVAVHDDDDSEEA